MSKLTVRNPLFSNRFDILSHFDSLFPSFYDGHVEPKRQTHGTVPRANILKKDLGYTIELAAPGFSREDFEMNADNQLLTISVNTESEKDHKDSILSQEWSYNSFKRVWTLPENTNIDGITARYEAGILLVDVPTDKNRETRRVINVE